MKEIKIFDTTLRDGEQSPGCSMTLEEKVEMARQLEKLNVDVIEAGFAASNEKDLKAIQEISKAVEKPVIAALARLTKNDIDKAYESLKYAKKKRIHTFIATSEIHMKDKLHMTKEEILMKVRSLVTYAKSLCEDIEFSLEDATRTEKDFMAQVISVAIESGANVINIPDTVGYIQVDEYKKLIKYIKENVPNINEVTLSAHCHNDKGLAIANTLGGITEGITQVECTVLGIGERAGNASLETIAINLDSDKEYYNAYTNINKKEILNTCRMLSNIINTKIPRNQPIVGENASLHASGVHQHAVINNKKTYEVIDFEELGIQGGNIVIEIHSGKHAINKKIEELGIEINDDDIDIYVAKIKEYLEDNKTIDDETFKNIVIKAKRTKSLIKK